MRIVTARRVSQAFFLLLFLWLCVVTTAGERWWQLRGWPKNWLLQLDPLVALGTILTTGTLFAGLLWALATVVLTIVFGRFFCGWVCPFGTMHHFAGWLGRRTKSAPARIEANQYRRAQAVKYYILIFILTAAAGGLITRFVRAPKEHPLVFIVVAGLVIVAMLASRRITPSPAKAALALVVIIGSCTALAFLIPAGDTLAASLQSGLLDPIPLVHRSVNLVVLPLADAAVETVSPIKRYYEYSWLIGAVFLAAVFLNLWIPRFYCRFVCPLGALFGVLGRFAIWRIGRKEGDCVNCRLCERDCEGACRPAGEIRISECVLCMNCVDGCRHGLMRYQTARSAAGEISSPDISRRGFLLSVLSGVAAVPLLRLGGKVGPNWHARLIRPPGSLAEESFLSRCVKCGQCMRICPTNVLQPAGVEGGLEGLWTPALNNRIGSSGCQLNCVACSQVCPTGAIRPIGLDEKLGRGQYAQAGPIRLGTAFVDRGRCLPWAMDRPCIVCQENCPVSPKAIFLREQFQTIREGRLVVADSDPVTLRIGGQELTEGRLATGDYYCRLADGDRRLIVQNTSDTVVVASGNPFRSPPAAGTAVEVQVRLQRPQVDPEACIGCGICEHECPVSGRRAIRVTAENETRSRKRSLLA